VHSASLGVLHMDVMMSYSETEGGDTTLMVVTQNRGGDVCVWKMAQDMSTMCVFIPIIIGNLPVSCCW